MELILPSGPTPAGRDWGPDQLRLHRHLLRHPALLPAGSDLLLAVSGGQDSMALTQLLCDLRDRHGWGLRLWHGDHGWRPEAPRQAEELAAWARRRDLPLLVERASPGALTARGNAEERARQWRYRCLAQAARRLGCRRVVTAHTASDRAETVLLHLARGSHLDGLGSLRASRPLEAGAEPLRLVRPLLILDRADTARLCRERDLPVWLDPSNADPRYSRNRVRAAVMPVLEALHPGAARRISAQAERLGEEAEAADELSGLALAGLLAGPGQARTLRRRELTRLTIASQRRLLQHWLQRHTGRRLPASTLDTLLSRLPPARGPGLHHLSAGWRLVWDTSTLSLVPPDIADGR